MKTTKTLLSAIAVAATVAVSSLPAFADGIMIDNIRARPTLGAGNISGAFFTIHNKGGKANKLIKAESKVSDRVELHTHLKENGVFKMRQVQSIAVPADGMTELKPGGLHVMLIDIKSKLKIGDKFKLKLTFANGEVQTLDVPVLKIGGHGMMKMDHKKMHGMKKMGDKKMDGMKKMDHKKMDGMKKKMPTN